MKLVNAENSILEIAKSLNRNPGKMKRKNANIDKIRRKNLLHEYHKNEIKNKAAKCIEQKQNVKKHII